MLAVHPRAEFLGTLSAGLLAFDAPGPAARDERPRDLLSGLDVAPGTPFERCSIAPYELCRRRNCAVGRARLRDAGQRAGGQQVAAHAAMRERRGRLRERPRRTPPRS